MKKRTPALLLALLLLLGLLSGCGGFTAELDSIYEGDVVLSAAPSEELILLPADTPDPAAGAPEAPGGNGAAADAADPNAPAGYDPRTGAETVYTDPPEAEAPAELPPAPPPGETLVPAAETVPPQTTEPAATAAAEPEPEPASEAEAISEDGEYTAPEDVAEYISLYGHLPGNYITKRQAQNLGWPGGDLWKYAPGKSIGGDRFGNYEGLLPAGGSYRECDVNYEGGRRGAERLIYDTEGNVWYTADHYESFEKLK